MVEGVMPLNGEKQIEYTFQSTFRKSLHDDCDISTDYSNGNNNSNNGSNSSTSSNSNRKNLKIEKISTSIAGDNGHGTAASHAGKRKVCPGSYALLSTSNDHNSDDDTRNESEVQNVSTHLRKVF